MKKMTIPAAFIILSLFSGEFSLAQSTVKESRKVKDFTRISFGVSGNLYIKFGPEFDLVIEGDKRDVSETLTEVSGGKLIIKRENWRMSFNDGKVTVNITMPEIRGLGVSGSGRAEITDAVKEADDLYLNVSGSGKILTAGVQADRLSCSISGSGDIKLGSEGSADSGDISISGSGSYTGEMTEIDHLKVSVSGSGDCYCKVGDSLDAGVSGSGNVTYTGNPKLNAHVSGSGHVRSK